VSELDEMEKEDFSKLKKMLQVKQREVRALTRAWRSPTSKPADEPANELANPTN
jgi:DNA-directed RNA polymerase specialized sigma54-like protein